MIDTLLPVLEFGLKSVIEPTRYLAKEHSRLRERIKEPDCAVRPDISSTVVGSPSFCHSIEHSVGELRRCEHLVVGKIRYASQNVWVTPAKRKARLIVHMASIKPSFKRE